MIYRQGEMPSGRMAFPAENSIESQLSNRMTDIEITYAEDEPSDIRALIIRVTKTEIQFIDCFTAHGGPESMHFALCKG